MNPLPRRLAIGSAATVLLISGFAAVSEAKSSGGGRPHDGRGHGFGGAGFARGLIHGEGVVKKKDGTFATESVQTGKASSVSTTALTVTSDDGFTRTYVLDSATKGTATDAATVTVVALKAGSSWTAQAVFTPGAGHHRGPHQPKPSSSASPTA